MISPACIEISQLRAAKNNKCQAGPTGMMTAMIMTTIMTIIIIWFGQPPLGCATGGASAGLKASIWSSVCGGRLHNVCGKRPGDQSGSELSKQTAAPAGSPSEPVLLGPAGQVIRPTEASRPGGRKCDEMRLGEAK